jgi:hypothetical protein
MTGRPVRTIDPRPRIVGRTAVYTVVDEHLKYVRVYVPFSASDIDTVTATIHRALDGRPSPPKRTDFTNG